MFGVANTCIGECNMPEHLRSSNFSTPCRCLGVRGGARALSRKTFLKRTDMIDQVLSELKETKITSKSVATGSSLLLI